MDFFSANSSLQNSFYQVQVVYDFSESILISSKDYRAEDAGLLLTTFGSNSGTANIVSELIAEWQLYNIYAVPKEIQEWINKKFPSVRFWHQYTLAIKYIVAATANGSLLIDIRKTYFTLIASKNSQIRLGQTFEYSTPEDSFRYLLKIVLQFTFSQR